MIYKLLGIALTIIGIISLMILLYVEYILINPFDPILWYLVVIVIILGAVFFLLGSLRRKTSRISL